MNTFLTLLKNNFQTTSSLANASKKNKTKKKNNNKVFIIILFLMLSILYNFTIISSYYEMMIDINTHYITILSMSAVLAFMLNITMFPQAIFNAKDYELLQSLPIKKTTIISAKLCTIILMDILESAIIVIPGAIIAMVFGADVTMGILTIFSILYISFIPVCLASLIAYLFTLITAKLKYKNIVTVLLFLIFMVAYCIFVFSIIFNGVTAMQSISKLYPPIIFVEMFLKGDILVGILYILASIVAFVLVVLLTAFTYDYVNLWISKKNSKTEYIKTGSDNNIININKLLRKKEIKSIFGRPNYLINSYVGILMMLVFSFVMPMIMKSSILNETSQEDIIMINCFTPVMTVGLCAMLSMISSSTVASISLEGESLYYLKSLPIDLKLFIKNKVIVGLIIPLICIILGTILFIFVGKVSFVDGLFFFIITSLSAISIALFGIYNDLKYPNLKWDNEMQVLKNSKPVLISTLVSMVIGFIVLIVGIVLSVTLSMFAPNLTFIAYIIMIIILLIWLFIIFLLFKSNSKRLFERI